MGTRVTGFETLEKGAPGSDEGDEPSYRGFGDPGTRLRRGPHRRYPTFHTLPYFLRVVNLYFLPHRCLDNLPLLHIVWSQWGTGVQVPVLCLLRLLKFKFGPKGSGAFPCKQHHPLILYEINCQTRELHIKKIISLYFIFT